VLLALVGTRSRVVGVQRPAATASTTPLAQAAAQQTLVQQYCITCHNDRAKQGGLSLELESISSAADHPEVWEKVVRKLRAGVMPPPGVRRPPLAEYEALRDWLEVEIDRKATRNPGAIVLHRLNRTEYANAVRDLLALEIDASAMLPPDDSARGFDNIAGSLTISPTLLEAYVGAATRVSRMAVGYWKTPSVTTFLPMANTSSRFRTTASAATFPERSSNSASMASACSCLNTAESDSVRACPVKATASWKSRCR
jgi:mono/diheme cytochrome c family protein